MMAIANSDKFHELSIGWLPTAAECGDMVNTDFWHILFGLFDTSWS
jgi:hypothetical protein